MLLCGHDQSGGTVSTVAQWWLSRQVLTVASGQHKVNPANHFGSVRNGGGTFIPAASH
jgi:hypothetical protein